MLSLSCLGLSAALLLTTQLAVTAVPTQGALEVQLTLEEALPEAFTDALPSGAVVRVIYPIRVRKKRSFIWDGRVWKGEVTSRVAFDPLTGRYFCELLLDEVLVTSQEVETAESARLWLLSPPPIRLVFDEMKDLHRLYVRARAVFSTSTTMLVFPNSEGTKWTNAQVLTGTHSMGGDAAAPRPSPDPD
jgi:hypothetical protein